MVNRRVVFVNRFFYPDHCATSQLLSDLCFALARQGESVSVITSQQRIDKPDARLPARETIHGVQVRRVWSPHFGRQGLVGRSLDYLGFYLSAAYCTYHLLEPGDVLVAKTDPPMLSVVMAQVAAWRGARLVNWLQDLFPEVAQALGVKGFASPLTGILRRLRNRSLQQAQMNIVLGRLMFNRLRAEGVAAKQLRIIHNWADGQLLQPLPVENNPLRRAWQLNDKFVIEYSGNMGRAHEFDTILDAALILKDHPRVCFLFIGSGALQPVIARGAQQRGLNNLLFKPYQDKKHLPQSLGAAHVHLISLNGKLEGLIVPSKFYGIAAAGRACLYLGDSKGEIGQIINASGCGICISPGDSGALVKAILTLVTDPCLCRELGQQARKVFDARFDKSQGLRAWSEVLGL